MSLNCILLKPCILAVEWASHSSLLKRDGYEFENVALVEGTAQGALNSRRRSSSSVEEDIEEFRRRYAENRRAAEVHGFDAKCWMVTNGQPVERFEKFEDLTISAAFPNNTKEIASDFRISMPHLNDGAVPMKVGGKYIIFVKLLKI